MKYTDLNEFDKEQLEQIAKDLNRNVEDFEIADAEFLYFVYLDNKQVGIIG